MATERKEHLQVLEDDRYERRQRVVEYATPLHQVLVSRISQLIWLFAALIVGIISFRFAFLLIAANPNNTFVNFIYDVTDVLVAPFSGIVNNPTFNNGAVIDMGSLFAIIVYALATWILVALFRLIFSGTERARDITTVEKQR